MKPLLPLGGTLLFLLSYACTPYYLAHDFEARAMDHQTVAVVPFEMIYTGVRPRGPSATMICIKLKWRKVRHFKFLFTMKFCEVHAVVAKPSVYTCKTTKKL